MALSFSIHLRKFPKNFYFPFLSRNPRKTLIPFLILPKSMASPWTCSKCTFLNTGSQNPKCQICLSSRSPPPSSSTSSSNEEKWSCKACTFFNPYKKSTCEICGTRNSSFSSILTVEDEELELDSSVVGNVFMPLLQRCNSNKRKVRDEPVDVANDSVDLNVSRGVKSANKEVTCSDETRPKNESGTLKILSYNVWFAEDMELRIRMRAISDIIRLHSPDVICLQEVTPEIYSIFQRCDWWKLYKCSLSFDMAITRPYYCIQLSKLPVKSFICKQFSYSAMGRELCVAEVSVNGDTPMVIATTHLESPCPGPPNWDQMYSKERVQQAQEAVDFLKSNPNVIFCGDMNWDDKLDGTFPLPGGWVDVWADLKPNEAGWTYDTKSNPMLSANRKLQKRLDRFVVCFRDFKIDDIEMVGTEAIPEVTYLRKKGKKELELPVLPSDHFGLILTISAR